MKIYVQTEIRDAEGNVTETRGKQTLLETGASRASVSEALAGIVARLGRIIAIPAAAHEANLRAILPRDVAASLADLSPAQPNDAGEATLMIIRSPGSQGGGAEVFDLAYRVDI